MRMQWPPVSGEQLVEDLKRLVSSARRYEPELGLIYLPQSLYDAAKRQGYNMTGYRPVKPMPVK